MITAPSASVSSMIAIDGGPPTVRDKLPPWPSIMVVHLYGNVADMDRVNAFAKKHRLFVVEDNAEAFGGSYQCRKTGTLSDIAGCSFCQSKTFTTGGEGGMVTTDNEEVRLGRAEFSRSWL